MEAVKNIAKKLTPAINGRMYLWLRARFILMYFILILVPFVIFSLTLYRYSGSTIDGNYYELSMQNIKQTGLNLENYIGEMELFSEQLSKDSSLTGGIFAQKKLSDVYGRSNSRLYNAYASNGQNMRVIFSRNIFDSSSESALPIDWYKKTISIPYGYNIIGTNPRFYDKGLYNYVVSVSKAVINQETWEVEGAILIDYDYNSLADVLNTQNYDSSTGSELYITDAENTVMYSTDPGLLTLKLNYGFADKIGHSLKSGSMITKDGKRMYLLYHILPETSWKVIRLIPAANVPHGIFASKPSLVVYALLCLLAAITFPFIIMPMFFKPLRKLTAAISQHEKQKLEPREPTYEVRNNGNGLSDKTAASENIEGLINKLYYSQLKQKEVQLMALQNQINPHFLYNTLESIRGAALHNGVQSIASMAKSLSSFFRYSIGEEVLVPIKAEIQHLENYIAIQNFRHDDKFELVYNVPEELCDRRILKLTLQPLVENAIKHGLEMKMGKGLIRIDVLDMESIIKIRVFDDGMGMPPEKMAELNKMLEQDIPIQKDSNTGTGVGVRNVNSRIKLYFGSQYGLRYIEAAVGTTVEVTFPSVE